ncbi:MAG TPA: DUF4097 family beta strand repeat-containing protein [Bacilli bacterium]|nr:DUF4097 family beta strand repeat-containing protein [Bacilli bacterium]
MKNKNYIITLIVVLGILIVVLLGGMFFFLGDHHSSWNFNIGFTGINEKVYEETFDNNYNLINVKSVMGDVEFKNSTDDKVKVVIYSKKDQYSVDEKDDELEIETTKGKCTFLCFNVKSDKIVVYLPSSYDKNININNDYGDIYIDNFKEATFDIKEDCGDIKMKDASKANIVNKYGDITVGKVNKITINEDCGDVSVEETKNIKVVNKYGDIKINKLSGYIKANNDCGDINIKSINLTKDSSINDNLGDIKIGDTNEIYIDAKTSLGDVDINNNERKAKVVLTIKNSCGDIEVNN